MRGAFVFARAVVIVVAIAAVPLIAQARDGGKDPPVITQNDMNGRPFQTQDFDGGKVAAHFPAMSIAKRYYLAGGRNEPVPASDAAVECEIGDDGVVQPWACVPLDPTGDGSVALRIRAAQLEGVSRFSVIDRTVNHSVPMVDGRVMPFVRPVAGSWGPTQTLKFYRLVHMTAHIDQFDPPPQVDLGAGPLVNLLQIPAIMDAIQSGKAHIGSDDYPLRALWESKAGRLTLECQVQADLSVICHQAAFDPPENAPYFADFARQAFLSVKVGATLLNGTSAVGVRFPLRVRMVPQPN